jgi:hypothetical protein
VKKILHEYKLVQALLILAKAYTLINWYINLYTLARVNFN